MAVYAGSSPFDVVFSIAGSFDRLAASQLREQLSEVPPDANVLLDFTRAGDVSDLALAVLAAAIAARGHPRVTLRGLTHHQGRLLQYLGVEGSALDARFPDGLSSP